MLQLAVRKTYQARDNSSYGGVVLGGTAGYVRHPSGRVGISRATRPGSSHTHSNEVHKRHTFPWQWYSISAMLAWHDSQEGLCLTALCH